MPKSVKKKIKVIHHNTRPKQALWIDFEVSRNFFPTQFFFKKLRFFFLMFIYLFGCTKSSLWHSGSSTFIAPCGTFSCSMWTLSCGMRDQVPWPGIEPWPPAWGAWNLNHWTTGKAPPTYFICILLLSTLVAVSGVLQTSHMTGVSQDSTYSCTHSWHLWQRFNKDTQPDHWEKESWEESMCRPPYVWRIIQSTLLPAGTACMQCHGQHWPLRTLRLRTSLAVQHLGLQASPARGMGSVPGWGTRCHMPQLKVPH